MPENVKRRAITAGLIGGVLFFIVAIIVSVCTVKICNRRKRRKQEQGRHQRELFYFLSKIQQYQMRRSHLGIQAHFYKLFHYLLKQNIFLLYIINFGNYFQALKAAALAGTAAGTCKYTKLFGLSLNNLFGFSDYVSIYISISAYNMVACRLTDMRNGNGANISQVPLKR